MPKMLVFMKRGLNILGVLICKILKWGDVFGFLEPENGGGLHKMLGFMKRESWIFLGVLTGAIFLKLGDVLEFLIRKMEGGCIG